jgi:hypothetical protein
MPAEKPRTRSFATCVSPTCSSASSMPPVRLPARHAQREDQVLVRGQVVVERVVVAQQADPLADGLRRADRVVAEDGGSAARRPQQCADDPQQRGLAAAVAAGQRQDLAGVDRQVHAPQDPALAEPAGDTVEPDGRPGGLRGRRSSCCRESSKHLSAQ